MTMTDTNELTVEMAAHDSPMVRLTLDAMTKSPAVMRYSNYYDFNNSRHTVWAVAKRGGDVAGFMSVDRSWGTACVTNYCVTNYYVADDSPQVLEALLDAVERWVGPEEPLDVVLHPRHRELFARRGYRLRISWARRLKMSRRTKRPAPKPDLPNAFGRRELEAYMRKRQPYLQPALSLTDLTGPLKIGSYTLSQLIKREYGVSFKTWINRLRLAELERLHRDPNCAHLAERTLIARAGFPSYATYRRTLRIEAELLRLKAGQGGAEHDI